MPRHLAPRLLLLAVGAIALSGCAQSSLRMDPEFGSAVRQDVAQQIADPDAQYTGTPAPGAAVGERVEQAQDRYAKDAVIQPTKASGSSSMQGSGGSSNDAAPSAK
jgi:hypothetical protein